MRQDWIEFKGREFDKFVVRPEYIMWVAQGGHNSKGEKPTYILVDRMREDGQDLLTVNEPYEQVKQKIMDAEKAGLNNVVVEHFTKEEYAHILELFENATDIANAGERKAKLLTATIMDKLYKIIKEDK